MTIASGSLVTAADYNTIQSLISQVLGVGSGDVGYGQPTASQPIVSGATVLASHWQNLHADINVAYTHQNGVSAPSSVVPVITSGVSIAASDVALHSSAANSVYNNRHTVAVANLSATAPTALTSISRTSAWGNSATGITSVASFTWASEIAARSFFNSGGYVTMSLSHPTSAATQDQNWSSFLSGFGTIVLGGTGCTKGGGNGTMNSIAYTAYAISGTVVLNTAMTTSAYASNYITITLTKIANGFSVTVLLEDNHTNPYYDAVSSGTKAAFGWAKANTSVFANAISTPTFTATTSF